MVGINCATIWISVSEFIGMEDTAESQDTAERTETHTEQREAAHSDWYMIQKERVSQKNEWS